MKNLGIFRLRDAILSIALLCSAVAYAQEMPGMMTHDHAAKVPSTSLTLALGTKVITLSPADLAALPHETVTVINGHTKASETYSGVPISTLLTKLGLPFEKPNEHALLKTYVIAEGTDGYKVLLSAYETLSAIREKSAIVADSLDGKPLDKEGAFKLIVPGDTRPQRWVQNLKSLTFTTIE